MLVCTYDDIYTESITKKRWLLLLHYTFTVQKRRERQEQERFCSLCFDISFCLMFIKLCCVCVCMYDFA